MKKSHTKGFTLIELLVVISIISFLSSIVLTALNNARIQARDTQRISDIRQIRIALELYRNTNGYYPYISYYINSSDASWNALQTALSPYMPKLPKDPTNNATDPWVTGHFTYAYGYDPVSYPLAGNTYDLVTQFESSSNPQRAQLKGWIQRAIQTAWYPTYSPNIYTGEY